MTFDTCQGEERDIIFYTMVADDDNDKLWGVFIKDLNKVDIEEGGQIKAQRLNVGFSRAKESIHFLSSVAAQFFKGKNYEFALTAYMLAKQKSNKASKETKIHI